MAATAPTRTRKLWALVLLGAFALLCASLHPHWLAWAGPWVFGGSAFGALAIASSAIALWTGSVKLRRVAAMTTLGLFSLLVWASRAGVPVPSMWTDARYQTLLAITLSAVTLGLGFRRREARWIALALVGGGAVTAGAGFLFHFQQASYANWLFGTFGLGCLAVFANLVGQEISATDQESANDKVWRSPFGFVRWLKAAIFANYVAVAMLLLYAWAQACADQAVAGLSPWLSLWLVAGAILSTTGRVVGVAMLGVGGLALFALSAIALLAASKHSDPFALHAAVYYLAFWIPAAALSIVSSAALLRFRA